jgi:hypothetical protein
MSTPLVGAMSRNGFSLNPPDRMRSTALEAS